MPTPADRQERSSHFYQSATVRADNGGFAVALDGRVAKTPGGARLIVPSEALAAILAAEWAAQDHRIDFAAMPATRLAFTAIDRTAGARGAVANEISKLIGADLLCYFADGPEGLIERQGREWGPWLAWAERTFGLVLVRAKGVSHQMQPSETLAKAKLLAAGEDDFTLTGLGFACGLYGSAVLALAVKAGVLDGNSAFDLSRLDEAFQEERWGVDHEAAARTEALRRDALLIDDWFVALRSA